MMWPVFPHGLGLRDSFPVSFKWFLALKPPPASSVPSLGGLGPSGGLPVRAGGDARHCIVCLATRVVGSLFEGEEVATRKP